MANRQCNFEEAIAAYDDAEVIKEIAVVILRDLPGAVAAMKSAMAANDGEELGASAHKLVASAGYMRATELQQQLRDLEQRAKGGTCDAELFEQVQANLGQFEAEIRAFMADA